MKNNYLHLQTIISICVLMKVFMKKSVLFHHVFLYNIYLIVYIRVTLKGISTISWILRLIIILIKWLIFFIVLIVLFKYLKKNFFIQVRYFHKFSLQYNVIVVIDKRRWLKWFPVNLHLFISQLYNLRYFIYHSDYKWGEKKWKKYY